MKMKIGTYPQTRVGDEELIKRSYVKSIILSYSLFQENAQEIIIL